MMRSKTTDIVRTLCSHTSHTKELGLGVTQGKHRVLKSHYTNIFTLFCLSPKSVLFTLLHIDSTNILKVQYLPKIQINHIVSRKKIILTWKILD